MNNLVTGEEPMYEMTMRQVAILRFMVVFAPQFIHPYSAADKAEKWADEYIKKLNEKPADIPLP